MLRKLKYVPILKSKRAEWNAVGSVNSSHFVPLFEVMPRDFARTKAEECGDKPYRPLTRFTGRAIACMKGRPFFLDFCHIDDKLKHPGSSHPAKVLFNKLRKAGQFAIPVLGLDSGEFYRGAVFSSELSRSGLCLRLHGGKLDAAQEFVSRCKQESRLPNEMIDIIWDFKTDTQISAGAEWSRQRIGPSPEWRSFAVAAGAFPRDLSSLDIGEHYLRRSELDLWARVGAVVNRKPLFADYTIQHAVYYEPPARANFSASIRYTLKEQWFVLRGQGVFVDGGLGFKQWPASAQVLCSLPEYYGDDFSEGDRYIHMMGSQMRATGSAETWLKAGIDHHISVVLSQNV